MDSNLWFLVERPSNRSWETGLLARKRERICWGTGSSNPSPSSRESTTNRAIGATKGPNPLGGAPGSGTSLASIRFRCPSGRAEGRRSILKRAPAPDVWVAPVLLVEVGKPSA